MTAEVNAPKPQRPTPMIEATVTFEPGRLLRAIDDEMDHHHVHLASGQCECGRSRAKDPTTHRAHLAEEILSVVLRFQSADDHREANTSPGASGAEVERFQRLLDETDFALMQVRLRESALRAEVERWRKDWQGALDDARRYKSALDSLVAKVEGLVRTPEWTNQGRSGVSPTVSVHRIRAVLADVGVSAVPLTTGARRTPRKPPTPQPPASDA